MRLLLLVLHQEIMGFSFLQFLADCYGDHVPVAVKLKLKLKKTQSALQNNRLDLAL